MLVGSRTAVIEEAVITKEEGKEVYALSGEMKTMIILLSLKVQ